LCRKEPVLPHYRSPDVELLGMRVIARANARREPLRACALPARPARLA
jgi:hypothetical protein